jgi:hypothetical protein
MPLHPTPHRRGDAQPPHRTRPRRCRSTPQPPARAMPSHPHCLTPARPPPAPHRAIIPLHRPPSASILLACSSPLSSPGVRQRGWGNAPSSSLKPPFTSPMRCCMRYSRSLQEAK